MSQASGGSGPPAAPPDLPAGTVTFLFADIEGSTGMLARLGEHYEDVLESYRRIVLDHASGRGGRLVSTDGDGLFVAFGSARGAVAAAVEAQRALAGWQGPAGVRLRVRMGMHTGEATLRDDDYVGLDVHRAARIAGAAHGGQVLLSEATHALVHQAAVDGGEAGPEFRDIGRHRLRGLEDPEHLWQLVVPEQGERFPPPRTLDATPNNLPVQLTSFVGRAPELERATGLVSEHRLVTLTGPGGTGKTRIALQVAAHVVDGFSDGVWFVALAALRDPSSVPAAVLDALGVHEVAQRSPSERLFDYLADKHLLLVLDNLEQVLGTGDLIVELLRTAQRVHVLATSRAPLHVTGEQEMAVQPLALPPAEAGVDELRDNDAVRLFVDRARAVQPSFELTGDNAAAVAEICARLDGLPLAIELAAARVKLLSPQAMLERLEHRLRLLGGGPRDVPSRQQTLRGAIRWSHDLLDDDARALLARLSVFTAGCTLEHAEAVCGDGIDVLESLAVLVDHSLVRREDGAGETRFEMLETVREFAVEMLEDRGEVEERRTRHAETFLALAEEAEPHLLGGDQLAWTARLERESGNVRAALEWFCERGMVEGALRLGAALWRYWQKRHVHEGAVLLEEVLELPGVERHPVALARALEAGGGIAYWAGDLEPARLRYERMLDVAREIGDPGLVSDALYNLSFPLMLGGGDPARAVTLLADAAELAERAGDDWRLAQVRWGQGVAAMYCGDRDGALAYHGESLERARAGGQAFIVGWSLRMLALVYTGTGRYEEAEARYLEALELFGGFGDASAVALLLDDLAALAAETGEVERQVRLAAASHALQRVSGSQLSPRAGDVSGRPPVDRQAHATAWREGLAMSMADAMAYARRSH